MPAERHNRFLAKWLSTNETGEWKILILAIRVRTVSSGVACGLLGHEGPSCSVRGQERVVQLPALEIIPAVVKELAGVSN